MSPAWVQAVGSVIAILIAVFVLWLQRRNADAAPTAIQAYRDMLSLLPRLKTHASILLRTLDKFEAAGFSADADIRPTPGEVRQFAAEAGYPLDEIAKERGIVLPK
jgi:Co/Zn/Cd efflux system component